MRSASKFALVVVLAATAAFGGDKKPAESPGGKSVDSGSFGVYVSGKRIGTEKFNIEQFPDSSVVKSEFRTDDGAKSLQTAEMLLTTNGNLQRYTWNENSPGKASSVIEPQEQLLIQHISTGAAADKPIDQQYILPASTVVLDDYFFSQREVLLWRYLAGNCRTDERGGCPLKAAQFGAIIPRQRTSMLVTIHYVGKESVSLHGKKQELSRFTLQTDNTEWALWLDANYKLVRVYVASEALEAVRD